MTLETQLEAILFYKNEPLTIRELSKLLEKDEKEIKESLQNLAKSLEGRGICLIMSEKEVSLATALGLKDLIENIAKDEMSKEIGRAGLETLSIILYNGPISRREVDYIRGVSSAFTLRNLCVRGLIEKELDSKDQRIFRYKSSLALLAHLGLKTIEELPDFEFLKKEITESKEELIQENVE